MGCILSHTSTKEDALFVKEASNNKYYESFEISAKYRDLHKNQQPLTDVCPNQNKNPT